MAPGPIYQRTGRGNSGPSPAVDLHASLIISTGLFTTEASALRAVCAVLMEVRNDQEAWHSYLSISPGRPSRVQAGVSQRPGGTIAGYPFRMCATFGYNEST